MTAPTHITFAEFIYLLLLTTTGVALNAMNAVVIAVASLLPDVDTAASYVGRAFPFLSKRIERRFGHRTLTHSAIFIAALGIFLSPLYLFAPDLYVCLLIGYASHPFLDTMTVHGVKLFYPFSSLKCVFPLEVNNPRRYRLRTGSKIDRAIGLFFLLGCIPVFLIANQGYERFIRSAQKNIESAVRDYNEFSRDNIVYANVSAYNMLTKEPLRGTFEIVGALNPQTLVFKTTDGQLHTLGKDFVADYVAENVLCERGDPARSFVRNIDLSNQMLSQISGSMNTSAENYFFGDLSTADKVSLPENIRIFSPVTGAAGAIKFNYARYSDIRTFNLEYVFITKGILTVKSIIIGKTSADRPSSGVSLPKFENYTQISFTLEAKESVVFFKSQGDTVREKETIARKDLAQFYQDQVNLNEGQIKSLEDQNRALMSDIDQKIANTGQAAIIDSVDLNQRLKLFDGGFLSEPALRQSELKWQRSKAMLSQLFAIRSAGSSRISLQIRKLNLANRQLKARATAAEKQSEIHSTVNGLLIDIRQIPHNNKTQITFIIKRFSNK